MNDNVQTETEKPMQVEASELPDLLPCPFCGSKPQTSKDGQVGDVVYYIICGGCKAAIGRRYFENVQTAWNARAR